MPNTLLHKRNSTANSTPAAGNLTAGELAINTADGRLFTKNSAGTVVNLPVTSISGQDITPNTVDTVSLGAAATPAHSFSTDTDTGMYSPGANALAFSTGGTQRIRVDSSGRVNIGTATSWTSRLLVDNGSMPGSAQTEIFQVLDSSSSGDYINLGRFNVNRNAARGSFSLSNSGSGAWENNVMQFFVHGSTYAHGYYGGNTSDAGCAMIVTQGSNIQKLQIGNYNSAPIEFFTSNTPRVKIATDGKVGIGQTTPGTKLHVTSDEDTDNANGNAMFLSTSTTTGSDSYWRGLTLTGASNLTVLNGCFSGMAAIGAHSWTNAATQNGAAWADLYLNPDGAANVYIGSTTSWTANQGILCVSNSTGRVGIGTAEPDYTLQVGSYANQANAYVTGALYVSDVDGSPGKISADSVGFFVYNNMGWSNTVFGATCDVGISMGGDVIIRHLNGNFTADEDEYSGRLGVGVATPTARLDVNGTALIRGRLQSPQTALYLWQNFR